MRQEALRNYLREVAKDLVLRGVLRHQKGQTVIDLLKQDVPAVVGSILRDFKDAGFSIGMEIVGGAWNAIFSRR